MDIGRNSPCPCGSGRKFKKCCLAEARPAVDPVLDIRRFQEDLEIAMTRFARRTFGDDLLGAALGEFTPEGAEFDPRGPDSQLLYPWFLYTWRPRIGPGPDGERRGPTVAESYLASRAGGAGARERAFVEAVGREPFSFYEAIACDPGKGMRLRDVLRQAERDVEERSGSRSVERGDILLARVVTFEGHGLMVGCGAVPLPPMEKRPLLDLRRSLRSAFGEVSGDLLDAIGFQLRELYFDASDRVMNPAPPVLQNTDGEPLVLHTLTYETEGAAATFHALKPLAWGHTEEDLLLGAVTGADGALRKVEFPWAKRGNRLHRSWDNTILGHIRIEGTRLVVAVNSVRRAERIQAQIRKRLGDAAILMKTDVRMADELRAEARSADRTGRGRKARQEEGNRVGPEAEEALRRMIEAHWRDWLENRIPALYGRTPLQAVRDPEGREMVEAILLEAERVERRRDLPGWRYDFRSLRRRLGLDPPTDPR
jgi:hypothetical protein